MAFISEPVIAFEHQLMALQNHKSEHDTIFANPVRYTL